jgi:hypothetical protein
MKNKPYPALLRPSNLSNEIKKRVPKSRETIPLIPRDWCAVHFSYGTVSPDFIPLVIFIKQLYTIAPKQRVKAFFGYGIDFSKIFDNKIVFFLRHAVQKNES